MNVCVISGLYSPYTRGGAETVVKTVVNEMRTASRVSVITTMPFSGLSSFFPSRTEEEGVVIYRFYPLNIFSYISIGTHSFVLRILWHVIDFFNIHAAITTWFLIKHIHPQRVYTHNLKGLGFLVPFVTRLSRVFHVHTSHDVQLVEPSGLMIEGERVHLIKKVVRHIWTHACKAAWGSPDCVIFPSSFLEQFYCSYGFFQTSKKHILPNPTPTAFLTSAWHEHDDVSLPLQYLFVGQLESHKGILFLIDTFVKWRQEHAVLLIVGDGSLKDSITHQCAVHKNIRLLGKKNHEELITLFSRTHFLIVPSICIENSPQVILESMSQGVPVLVSRVGGAHELVESDVHGYHFQAHHTQSLLYVLQRSFGCKDYLVKSRSCQAQARRLSGQDYCLRLASFS